ncbi:MAG: histone deacetylase [Gammaproteobacteria bacterium]|nr:histone deacetylase [Gammaproteobacteria bacterium]NBP07374.1 histone deacetylase [Gammaproteobacteria bacterium]NBR17888.1 histone deacetylase [Gammaproteobacteria bacterium]NCW57194.1 histone deacetylase [Gammaproteobacteria bacterium]NDB24822.1 histone deacetylase [Gammaproteobacteria bacterium]
MKVSHHPDYHLPLPEGHPFPMVKYTLVYDRLRAAGLLPAERIMLPDEATRVDLERVHTREYLDRLFGIGLSAPEQRALGVPWSPRLLRRSRLAVQGTLLAARAALEDGRAGNLAGGTHHAFADHGEGFCVLNDVAIAIRRLQADGRLERALVVDLDVHQGNGTAAIFEGDESVFTFSIHGERNYPARKMRSTLDVGLPDGVDDDAYLGALQAHLPVLTKDFRPDIVFYLAGVDVAEGDRYGKFRLSEAGIRARERCVLDWTRKLGVPLVITLAGGYSPNAVQTAILHSIVFEEAINS